MFRFKPTAKGLLRAEFKDRLGATCAIQESSRPEESSAWLGVEIDLDGDELRYGKMLLTQEMAKDLIPILRHFARTGRIGEDDPGERYQVGTWVKGVSIENKHAEGRVIATGDTVVIQDHTRPGVRHEVAWDKVDLLWEPQHSPETVATRYERILSDDDTV